MSSKRYVTFWFPTIYHQDIKRNPGIVFKEDEHVDDGDTASTYRLKVEIGNNEDIVVTSWLKGRKDPSFIVKLIKTDNHKNGFVQYWFDAEGIPNIAGFEKVIKNNVYHLAKEFYHKHEIKNSEKDSALKPIITDGPERVNSDDNSFITGFLTDYTSVFQDYASKISEENALAQEAERQIEDLEGFEKLAGLQPRDAKMIKKYLDEAYDLLVEKSRLICGKCESALIEYTYCKTLLSSKYNKSFHHNLITGKRKQDIYRRQALNIRNSIRYIENIKYKNQNRLNLINKHLLIKLQEALDQGKRTERRNTLISIFSIVVAIMFGVVIFIYDPSNRCSCAMVWWLCIFVVLVSIFARMLLTRVKTRAK